MKHLTAVVVLGAILLAGCTTKQKAREPLEDIGGNTTCIDAAETHVEVARDLSDGGYSEEAVPNWQAANTYLLAHIAAEQEGRDCTVGGIAS